MGKKRKLVRLRWYNEVHRKPKGRLDDGEFNILAMQMQLYEHKKFSLDEISNVWSCLDADCYDINGRCTSGIPPIVYAAKKGGVFLLWMLLRYGADINAVSTMNESAPCAACRHQKFRALKFLTKRGAKLDRIDRSNFSCLRWAVYHGNLKMVQFLLLQPSISVLQDSYTSNSAIEIASAQGYERIVYFLEQKLVNERRIFLKELEFVHAKECALSIEKIQRKQKKEEEKISQKYLQEKEEEQKNKKLYFSSPFRQVTRTLRQKKKTTHTTNTHVPLVPEDALSMIHLQNSMNTIRNVLAYQFIAVPSTWVRVNKGQWRLQHQTNEDDEDHDVTTSNTTTIVQDRTNATTSSREDTVGTTTTSQSEDTGTSSTPIMEIQVEAQTQVEVEVNSQQVEATPIEMTQVIDISQENLQPFSSPSKRLLNLSPLKPTQQRSPTRKQSNSKSPIKKFHPQSSSPNKFDVSPKKIQQLLHSENNWNTFNQEIDAEVAVVEHPIRRHDVQVEDLE